ncbi:MAG: SDR family oxidoreductase, partial [Stackebrandtia sp.]
VAGERYYPAELDVREPGALAQARQTLVDRWSAPNLIIVNAGLYRPDHATTEAVDWDELFDVSGRGVVETVRVFLPDLLAAADAGRLADLVVIGAIPSESEHTDSTIFTAAAAAIGWFMSGLRARFQERGLRVSHVAPGYVDTARPQTISDTDTEPQPREALRPSDFADIIGFALDQPAEVSIGEMVLVSTPSA